MTTPWIVWAALLAATAEPPAPEEEAVTRAEQAFAQEDYGAAADAFGDAYASNPLPRYLWAQAQAERLAGDCAAAVILYDRFLDTGPADKDERDAREAKHACQEQLGESAPAEPPEPEPRTAPTTTRDPGVDDATGPIDPAPPSRWYRDPWGGALVGSGVFVGGIGTGLLVSAIRLDREAADAATEGLYETGHEDAVLRQRVGIATLSVGSALVIAGAVRWAIVGTRSRRARTALVPAGSGVALVGRF